MTQYVLPDARVVADGQPFELAGVSYPANWLALSTSEERQAAGIVEAPAPGSTPPTKAELKMLAADKRWRVEIGGMVWNGMPVPTDDRAKLLLLGAGMTMDPGDTAPLVIAGVNYGTLTGAQFAALNTAVITHVQTTFAVLADVLAAIDGETVTTAAEIEAWPQWPPNS